MRESIGMVNASLPFYGQRIVAGMLAAQLRGEIHDADVKDPQAAFAQILGKLYFLQLPENLRRILLDYGQKPTSRANSAFNAAC
jgi:hypothetical protein